MSDELKRRKESHLSLCIDGEVEPEGNDALFGEACLLHDALPELKADALDLSTQLWGKRLAAPLYICAMTGGTERARRVNLALAEVAQSEGVALGLGSQRAMLEDPNTLDSFKVRGAAPTAILIGNLGLWQARDLGAEGVLRLMERVEADAMAIHLNAAQELIQPGGDRDFEGGLDTLARLAERLGERLLVKETGCGLSPSVLERLLGVGITHFDLSGLGGTSWIRAEALRSEGRAAALGTLASGWGLPTAACLGAAARRFGERATLFASGGIRDGLDAARALAMGAAMAGAALPFLRAHERGGAPAVRELVAQWRGALQFAMALTGSRTLADLRRGKVLLGPRLSHWVEALAKV